MTVTVTVTSKSVQTLLSLLQVFVEGPTRGAEGGQWAGFGTRFLISQSELNWKQFRT